MSKLDGLRKEWTELYSQTLPKLAKSRNQAQPKWPVTLDHCFARIILDNTVGEGRQQWDKVIRKPAVRHMDEQQLRLAISLGEQIEAGTVNLCFLDELSLRCRGKNEAKHAEKSSMGVDVGLEQRGIPSARKRKIKEDEDESVQKANKASKCVKEQSKLNFSIDAEALDKAPALKSNHSSTRLRPPSTARLEDVDKIKVVLIRIQNHAALTPYRKKLYTALLSVPNGRYTTYAKLSDFLESSARAVGSGMRNNPFAPDVPCHRVLAANGSIGGFGGDWGKDGRHAKKKVDLLRSEGVMFDTYGKVVGEPFRKFHLFQDMNPQVE